MSPEKLAAARAAIERLIFKLLDEDDELFFVEFATRAEITQGWTTDRQLISDALKQVVPVGGTALYDAVAAALPTAQEGRNRKKALLVISDGNDTNSSISVSSLRQRIRESEVLVYALGVDSTSQGYAARDSAAGAVSPQLSVSVPGQWSSAATLPAAAGAERRRGRGARASA